jgi:hypothetical protein
MTSHSIRKDPTKVPESSRKMPSKSLTGPDELSETCPMRLLDRLDSTDQPFKINTIPLSRKRKRSGTRLQVQDGLFEERLAVQYKVEPGRDWESLRQYKEFTDKKKYAGSFTVDDEAVLTAGLVGHEIARGDFILVSHNITEYPVLDSLSDWKAKVLEVRALDAEHVYVRVGWLNRPEDLKDGRQGHNGKKELMPKNQMDFINAIVVSGTFQSKHYDELTAHDQKDTYVEDEYFWKQTFHFTTQSLSVRLIVNSLR